MVKTTSKTQAQALIQGMGVMSRIFASVRYDGYLFKPYWECK